ncbi:hypothetical protein MRX96_058110 [Rhipicephalus microplus]
MSVHHKVYDAPQHQWLDQRAKYYVNGRQVCGYDLVNATLHCACSVLVAVVARRVMRIAALHACLATMLFAAHPVHAEAMILLLCFRLWILQGSFPEFSKMDNPASFSSSRITRNLATLTVVTCLLALGWRAVNTSNEKDNALHYILKDLEQCDVDDLHCANIHSIHSGMLKDLGDLTSSAQSYEAAIRLDPYLAHAHLDLAVIRHLKEFHDEKKVQQHCCVCFSCCLPNRQLAAREETCFHNKGAEIEAPAVALLITAPV